MICSRSAREIAKAVLGVLLFAQVALAVAACDWLRIAPAQAVAAKPSEPTCHDEPSRNANLCLSHCLGSDQNAGILQVPIPAWSQTYYFLVIADIENIRAPQVDLRYTLPRPGAPPPRVLFQTFLI